jgi:hypothetical protein
VIDGESVPGEAVAAMPVIALWWVSLGVRSPTAPVAACPLRARLNAGASVPGEAVAAIPTRAL